MVLFKKVWIKSNGRNLILKNLNLENVTRIMMQNQMNTIILDINLDRFLFYDVEQNSNKYELYDIHTLSNSSEIFEKALLVKSNDILNKISRAEHMRLNYWSSSINYDKKEKQSEGSDQFDSITSNSVELLNTIRQEQGGRETNEINYNKTILQCDDDDLVRPTFDDIIAFPNAIVPQVDDLKDDDEDDVEKQIDQPDTLPLLDDLVPPNIRKYRSSDLDFDSITPVEKYIIATLSGLSSRIENLEHELSSRIENLEQNVNKRLASMETNINLIYERQSVESLTNLLDSMYLISSDRLETRTFFSTESDFTLKFFHFVSRQMIQNYTNRWSPYAYVAKKLSLKPKSIEVNLLGFGRLQKCLGKKKKLSPILSPASLKVDQKVSSRYSYVSQCRQNSSDNLTHVLAFEGTTSPVYFEVGLLNQFQSSSCNLSMKRITSMKNFLKK